MIDGGKAGEDRRGRYDDLFRLLIESAQDYAIFLLDPSGHIMTWNEGARRIKGYDPEEIIGKHFSIFYPPGEVRRGKPEYALKTADDDGHWQEEGWRIRKDGSRFWASVTITALRNANGQVVGFAKVTRDLTERKRAEDERSQLLSLERAARDELERAVEQLRAVQSVTETALGHLTLDNLLEALLDKVGEILSVDTVAVLLLEDPDKEVLVARAARGIEDEVEQGVRIPLGRGFAGRVAAESRPIVLDDGDHAEVLNPLLREKGIRTLLGVPLMIRGEVIGVLHVGSLHHRRFAESDVKFLQVVGDRVALAIDHARLLETTLSAREKAEIAETTVRAQEEFLAVAAHELKTPMTSLHLSAQLMLRRLDQGRIPDPVQLRRAYRTIEQQSSKLSRLVAQLLEAVRLQAGGAELQRSRANLGDLVAGLVKQIQSDTVPHELVLAMPEPVWASVDVLRFEQVVTNLLDNAVRFSPAGGQIDVELTHPKPDIARLTVRDHGIGVPAEHRPHLFERFYQAHRSDHRSGMGLGLYVCREIVEKHGGHIEAEFPPDGGTRFVVELPAQSGIPCRKRVAAHEEVANTVHLQADRITSSISCIRLY